MKLLKRAPLRTLAALALFALAMPQTALAIGTEAGTTISNTASVSYSLGAVSQRPVESSPSGNSVAGTGNGTATTFLVDNKVNLVTAELVAAATQAGPGQTNTVFAFNVSNTGNTVQDYTVVASNFAVGDTVNLGGLLTDDMDVTITAVAVDTSGDNAYGAGDTTTAGNSAVISNLSPSTAGTDSNITVFVLATVPISAVDGSVAVVGLNATTFDAGGGGITSSNAGDVWDTTTVQVVFADGAGSDDVALNGDYSARGAYVAAAALLTVTKSADVISDPFTTTGNPKAIPGAVIEYTVEINNSGTAAADSVILTDVLPATLGAPVTITGGTSSAYNSTTNTVTIDFGTIGAGAATATATIRAVIQ
ncbi:MAG: DUF11 domain-containing protein [bacterium]|nr:MAG: DUF11 domain-containing protein [bacterium]